MRFPTPLDYEQHLDSANLSKSILIPELKSGKVTTVPGPLNQQVPKRWPGGYAVVLQLYTPLNRKFWAMKCFHCDIPDIRHHYEEISHYLAKTQLPYFVECRYLENGIKVNNRKWPFILMDWVEGPTLKEYIEGQLRDPRQLSLLAESWRVMLRELNAHKLAHGDLQSENIKIVQGQAGPIIKLLDYDTLITPNLAGRPEGNTGLPAYQHPARKRGTPKRLDIDSFSGIVIYLSLRAFSEQPELWTKLDCANREKDLLFKPEDFSNPYRTATFQELLRSLSPELRTLMESLQRVCGDSDLSRIPTLEALLSSSQNPVATVPITLQSWLPTSIPAGTASAGVTPAPAQQVGNLSAPAPVWLQSSMASVPILVQPSVSPPLTPKPAPVKVNISSPQHALPLPPYLSHVSSATPVPAGFPGRVSPSTSQTQPSNTAPTIFSQPRLTPISILQRFKLRRVAIITVISLIGFGGVRMIQQLTARHAEEVRIAEEKQRREQARKLAEEARQAAIRRRQVEEAQRANDARRAREARRREQEAEALRAREQRLHGGVQENDARSATNNQGPAGLDWNELPRVKQPRPTKVVRRAVSSADLNWSELPSARQRGK